MARIMAKSVDGYTIDNPVLEEDWEDEVRWQVNQYWTTERRFHNQDGFIADEAGSERCKALGHEPTPMEYEEAGEWYTELEWGDDDIHVFGWDGEYLCKGTIQGPACTECESEDCDYRRDNPENFWRLFRHA